MSMRQRVGQQEIEHFLVQVGRTRQPGRLYLARGAAMVHRGIRPGQTLDIDIQVTVDPANLTAEVVQLKQRLKRRQCVSRGPWKSPGRATEEVGTG